MYRIGKVLLIAIIGGWLASSMLWGIIDRNSAPFLIQVGSFIGTLIGCFLIFLGGLRMIK